MTMSKLSGLDSSHEKKVAPIAADRTWSRIRAVIWVHVDRRASPRHTRFRNPHFRARAHAGDAGSLSDGHYDDLVVGCEYRAARSSTRLPSRSRTSAT
jgi:hypothetical protein